MCEFLRRVAQGKDRPKEVGRLLSDMVMLADGQPAVDDMWTRWKQAVEAVRGCEENLEGYLCRWPPSVKFQEKKNRSGKRAKEKEE